MLHLFNNQGAQFILATIRALEAMAAINRSSEPLKGGAHHGAGGVSCCSLATHGPAFTAVSPNARGPSM